MRRYLSIPDVSKQRLSTVMCHILHASLFFSYSISSQIVEDQFLYERNGFSNELTKYYHFMTKTLDLSGAYVGCNLVEVLRKIRKSSLFNQIERLILRHNHFGDNFNDVSPKLTELPPNLKLLDLSFNGLSGPNFPWFDLPSTLQKLYLQNNRLEGTVDMSLLPNELTTLWLHDNEFEGCAEWHALPPDLYSFALSNRLTDEFRAFVPGRTWIQDHLHPSDSSKSFFIKSSFAHKYRSAQVVSWEQLSMLLVVIFMHLVILYAIVYGPENVSSLPNSFNMPN